MYRLVEKGGTEEVFLRSGKTFVLPYAAKSVTVLDAEGKEIGPVPFAVEGRRTRLTPVKNATSYRVVVVRATVGAYG